MALTLKLRQALVVDGDVLIGSATVDQTIGLTNGQVYAVREKVIADDFGNDVLWSTGDGGLDSYSQAFILSDEDLAVELKDDDGTPNYILLVSVKANVLTPLPFQVGTGTSAAIDGADLVDNTDYNDVAEIAAQRDAAEGGGDATVSLFLFN